MLAPRGRGIKGDSARCLGGGAAVDALLAGAPLARRQLDATERGAADADGAGIERLGQLAAGFERGDPGGVREPPELPLGDGPRDAIQSRRVREPDSVESARL